MYLALIQKELREILPIAAMGAIAYSIVIGAVAGNPFLAPLALVNIYDREVPFAAYSFLGRFGMVSFCFVTALGFRQSLMEERGGTYPLLLHRFVSRQAIFLCKLLAGAAVYLSLGSATILLLAIWAATPGNQPAPFFWYMTVPSWWTLLSMVVVYLGAFLSGIWTASWLGPRLFPWLASLLLLTFCIAMPSWGQILIASSIALFITNIFWLIQQRDFA